MSSHTSASELVPRADLLLDISKATTSPGPRLLAAASPLPLTTTFTPASECLNDFWMFQSFVGIISSSSYSTRWANLGPEDTKKCLPSGWVPSTFYSPGLVCPSGWAMAPGSTIKQDETTATCCPIHQPSSLTFTQRSPTSGETRPWHSSEVCAFGAPTNIPHTYTATPTPGITTSASATATAKKDGWNAYGIELRWKVTDLVSITSMSVPAASSATPSATSSTTALPTAQQQPEDSSGLSTGAKAGIGIGAVAGGILVILAVGYLTMRGRRSPSQDVSEPIANSRHELDGTRNQKYELSSGPFLGSNGPQASLKPPSAPAELEGRIER
ncbi:unnamed protein product [Penicillium salamii]|nr:unnamed protein product [Penicillium salamii]